MEFCTGEKFNAKPVAQDVIRAIDATPYGDGWFISLEADSHDLIEAFALKGGGFRLTSMEDSGCFEAITTVDAALLKTIFVKFLDGDATWRAHCEWRAVAAQDLPDETKTSSATPVSDKPSVLPQWLSIGIFGAIAMPTTMHMFFPGLLAQLQSSLPFAISGFFMFGLIACLIILGAIIFVVVKIFEARRTATWPQAPGRIVKARMEARRVKKSGEATSIKNVPVVEYEFSALGRKWSGDRINALGEAASVDAAATLARYRVGAVVSVFYDPADPGNCVLEHELPKGFGKGCAMSLAILAGIIGAIVFVATNASHWIEVYKPGPHFLFALAAGGFGLIALLFFLGVHRHSIEARNWPIVRGKILSSGTESFEKDDDGRTRAYYTAAVEYAYCVQGVDYRGRQIALAMTSSGSQSSAAAMAARYRVGEAVDVHYDTSNPSNAALEIGGNLHWIIFVVAMICFVIAVYASGVFW